MATAAPSVARPAERGWGGQPVPGVLAVLVGFIRDSLRLKSFFHHCPETTTAAIALPLPHGGFCNTDVISECFGGGLQGTAVTSEVL